MMITDNDRLFLVNALECAASEYQQLAILHDGDRGRHFGGQAARARRLAAAIGAADGLELEHTSSGERKPTLMIALEGGLVSAVCTDRPLDLHRLVVVDYDTDGADADEITELDQANGSTATALVSFPWLERCTLPLAQFDAIEAQLEADREEPTP